MNLSNTPAEAALGRFLQLLLTMYALFLIFQMTRP